MTERIRVYANNDLGEMFKPLSLPFDQQKQDKTTGKTRSGAASRAGTAKTPTLQPTAVSRTSGGMPHPSRPGSRGGGVTLGPDKSLPQRNSAPQTSVVRDHKRARLQKFWDEAQRDKIMNEKRARERREKELMDQDEKFKALITNLEGEKLLVDQVGDYLSLKDATNQRKKVQLFEQWNKYVFDPIQKVFVV
jgi:hypothetical protein